jgi:hypothetical protein
MNISTKKHVLKPMKFSPSSAQGIRAWVLVTDTCWLNQVRWVVLPAQSENWKLYNHFISLFDCQ